MTEYKWNEAQARKLAYYLSGINIRDDQSLNNIIAHFKVTHPSPDSAQPKQGSFTKTEVINIMAKIADEVRRNEFGGCSAAHHFASHSFNKWTQLEGGSNYE